ncbi:hypothetical protein [Sphingopyxis terrae]|uniref:hypothetical protein n=1 Tax=Sphingopyxis terrae TaxID=33052 RepID=UPI0020D23932|nr:hypothetical protein [Sphingopyxis terrae]
MTAPHIAGATRLARSRKFAVIASLSTMRRLEWGGDFDSNFLSLAAESSAHYAQFFAELTNSSADFRIS